jgi:hypothetical protein
MREVLYEALLEDTWSISCDEETSALCQTTLSQGET